MPPPPPSSSNVTRTAGTNGKAIASLVLGIVGVIIFGIILGPLAIVFAVLAKKEIARTGQGGNGMATAGLVLGIIAIVLFFVTLSFYF